MNVFVGLISRLLEPEERAFVLGDIAELNDNGAKAFRGIAGLVGRRQLALWKDWHPWLAMIGLVGVVCPMLLIVTIGVMSPLLLDLRTYIRVGSLYSDGLTSSEQFLMSAIGVSSLLLWSWTSGFVLGLLSRKTLWVTGTLYFLWMAVLLVPFAHLRSPVYLLLFTLQGFGSAVLFVYPSVKGLQYGLRNGGLTARHAILLTVVILCLTGLKVWTGGWSTAAVTRWAGGPWNPSPGWPSRLFFYLVLAWPATYLLPTAKCRQFAKLKVNGEF